MAIFNDETLVLMDGAAKVYCGTNTRRWQATFKFCGVWVRLGTGSRCSSSLVLLC